MLTSSLSNKRNWVKHHQIFSKGFIGFFLILQLSQSFGQDASFSQFYANPLYLNPALAGTGECSRIMLNYRNQWPALPNAFVTYSASADYYVEALSGGVGLLFNSDNLGNGAITTNRISAIYSYHLKLSGDADLNAGFEATYHMQKLNWDKLVFQDMIDPVTGNINPGISGEAIPSKLSVSALDFSGGLLLGIRKKFYLGFAVDHLTQPNLSYYAENESPLFLKYTAHLGMTLDLGGRSYRNNSGNFILSPNILYQQQQNARQLNAGFYVEKQPITIGFWYRHNFSNPDGVLFSIGLKQKKFRLGYSYDLTLSKLKSNTGGAHELSLAFLVNCNNKRNKPGAIKCPEF
ncbi:MAG: type IX secretion system membrane protein PorP/SprF [Chlorobi bacterium]|nr:type IX secretion system membrane protein PorP/SprF [Chlorobiota bacterium]